MSQLILLNVLTRNGKSVGASPVVTAFDVDDIAGPIREDGGNAYFTARQITGSRSSGNSQQNTLINYTVSEDLASLYIMSFKLVSLTVTKMGFSTLNSETMVFNTARMMEAIAPLSALGGSRFYYHEDGYSLPIAYEVAESPSSIYTTQSIVSKAYIDAQDAATLAASEAYADSLVIGLLDDRGNYDASGNTFPAAGGSGPSGAIMTGDIWYISVDGTLGGIPVFVGDAVRALVDSPAQTPANWAIMEGKKLPESIGVACSDETTALTTGTAKVTFRMPYSFTLTSVRANLVTAQTAGSIFTVDINESGTSVLSTKITIDNNEKTSVTAATPPVISDASLADDAEMTIDIDQVGNGTAKGLKVWLIGNRF